MRAVAWLVAAVLVASVAIPGCTQASGEARFMFYEVDKNDTRLVPNDKIDPNQGLADQSHLEGTPTGKAMVRIDNEMVLAECPIEGLRDGDVVVCERDAKGDWAVVSRKE